MVLFGIIHLVFVIWAPFVGFKLLQRGIFYAVIYHSKELASLSANSKTLLNFTSSALYVGSLLLVIIISVRRDIALNKKLLWTVILTLVPFFLFFIKMQFVPRVY